MGPDKIHLTIPKELADAIIKPSSMGLELSWKTREVSADWKLETFFDFQKDQEGGLWKLQAVSVTSVPGKTMEKIILGGFEKILGGQHSHQ